MQADQKPVIWTVVIATLVLLVAGIIGGAIVNSNLKLTEDALNDLDFDVDVDEQAIADAIMAGIVMPEWTVPEIPDTAKLNELWDDAYGPKVDALKIAAELEFGLQFLDDNGRDSDTPVWFVKGDEFFEDDEVFDLVTDDVDCDGDCVVKFVKEYDDMEIEVINLGLEEEDDREVELSTVIRVKVFTDEDDVDEYFFEKVYLDSAVTSDDGDLEAEVIYSL